MDQIHLIPQGSKNKSSLKGIFSSYTPLNNRGPRQWLLHMKVEDMLKERRESSSSIFTEPSSGTNCVRRSPAVENVGNNDAKEL